LLHKTPFLEMRNFSLKFHSLLITRFRNPVDVELQLRRRLILYSEFILDRLRCKAELCIHGYTVL